ncbi:DDE-type integrase/transposase/recombinase [Aestuariibius insulae]|uniref:DDE-type integrase/transposase/recombinase n=1 Tax=Aestuariibius insulae TaxID=2058287 RepID=UPI00345EA0EF
MVNFSLTAWRDANAAKAFFRKAIEPVYLHRPVAICLDKAQAYHRVIGEIITAMIHICAAAGTSTESGATT